MGSLHQYKRLLKPSSIYYIEQFKIAKDIKFIVNR